MEITLTTVHGVKLEKSIHSHICELSPQTMVGRSETEMSRVAIATNVLSSLRAMWKDKEITINSNILVSTVSDGCDMHAITWI